MKKIAVILSIVLNSFSVLAEESIQVTYEVPVSDETLKPFSTYQMKFNQDAYEKSPIRVKFPMPLELVGRDIPIELTKVEGEANLWTGPKAEAQCHEGDQDFICELKFHDLDLNDLETQKVIQATYKDSAEIAGRTAVALSFSTEPIGIVRLPLKNTKTNSVGAY